MPGAWHEFYETAGGASAALIGLLFVGLAIHLDTVVSRADVRAAARGAFQSLIAILVISLLALVPDIDGQSLGWTLVGLGGFGLLVAAVEFQRMLGTDLFLGIERATRRLGFRLAGLVLLVAGGTLFLTGQGDPPIWLMAAVFVLLGSSAQTAWTLLIEVARLKKPGGGLEVDMALPEEPGEAAGPEA